MQWFTVCSVEDLQDGLGVCALVEGKQVAIFYIADTGSTNLGLYSNQVYAIGNYDPFGKANVLSRGIIGDIKGQPVVASPLYKQHFNLQTGICLEDESIRVPVYGCRIDEGKVQIEKNALCFNSHPPHPSSDTRRRIEVDGLFLPVNEEVAVKVNDTYVSLSL